MHSDPLGQPLTECQFDEANPQACPPCQPLTEGSVVIPFFRAIFDNVKVGRIGGYGGGGVGKHCWIEANNVFTFGVIPQLITFFAEAFPALELRNLAPYYDYVGDLCSFLRDEDFLRWHNGTMRRLPVLDVTGGPTLDAEHQPGVTFDCNPATELDCVVREPTYTVAELVPGMFQSPVDLETAGGQPHPEADTLAYVLTNPWVDVAGNFSFSFVFDPEDYPGWSGVTYSVEEHRGGSTTVIQSSVSGVSAPVTGLMAPGEIVYWVFRKL